MAKHGMEPQHVHIDVGDAFAVVAGASPTDVLSPVSFMRHGFKSGGRTGCRWTKGTAAMATINDDGTVVIPAGLTDRVAISLRSMGYQFTIRDHRQDRRQLQVNQRLRDEVTDAEQSLLDALEAYRGGQLHIRSEAQRVRAIELICRLYPQARVLIIVATVDEARRMYRKLRPGLRYDVCVGTGSTEYRSSNRLVSTIASGQIYDAGHWDIIVYAHAEQLAGNKAFEAALETAGPRIYGMIKSAHPLPLRTQLAVEGVCGPVIHEVPDPRGREADVRVVTLQAPWMPAPGKLTALERKRRMYWHNDKRNAAIADVAEAFADGDQESLWHHGLLLHDDADPVTEDNNGPRVAIVVESPEHGRALLECLPGWRLLDGAVQDDDQDAVDDMDHVIVTLVRAARLRQIDCDVLIWAVGGRSGINLRGFPPRSKDDHRHEVLLVDVADDFDDMAIEEAGSRRRYYQDHGWQLDGLNPTSRVTRDLVQLIKMPMLTRERTILVRSQPDRPSGINSTPNHMEDIHV